MLLVVGSKIKSRFFRQIVKFIFLQLLEQFFRIYYKKEYDKKIIDTMLLFEKYKHNFPVAVIAAGMRLVEKNEIYLSRASKDAIWAESADGSACSFEIQERQLVPQCSCHDFAGGKLCKHLFAALYLAQQPDELSEALKQSIRKKITMAQKDPVESPSKDFKVEYDRKPQTEKRTPSCQKYDSLDYSSSQCNSSFYSPKSSVPHYDPNAPNVKILYVIREETLQGGEKPLTVELWWKSVTKSVCKPLYPDETTKYHREEDALRMLLFMSLERGEKKGIRANAYSIPNDSLPRFFSLFAGCPNVRLLKKKDPKHFAELSVVDHAFLECCWRTAKELGRYSLDCTIGGIDPSSFLAIRSGKFSYALTESVLVQFNDFGAWNMVKERVNSQTLFQQDQALELGSRLLRETELQVECGIPELECSKLEEEVSGQLYIKTAQYKADGHEQLHAELMFDYHGVLCDEGSDEKLLRGRHPGELILRNSIGEDALREQMREVGFRWNNKQSKEEIGWKLLPARLEDAVFTLVKQDWKVTAEGKTYRKPLDKKAVISSSSGQDWFEIQGGVSFGNEEVPLPELLKMKGRGKKTIRLDDGTYGILPLEWLENFTALMELGECAGDKIRLRQQQALLLQALVTEQLEQSEGCLTAAVHRLEERNCNAVVGMKAPAGFQATLRPYQEDGLGWLVQMGRLGLGVCLADDMGLGKTIQVLALLATRHDELKNVPALIVLPKSLIFNWLSEAQNFAPHLRCMVHQGAGRHFSPAHFAKADLVFTTYGTLRQDVVKLRKVHFSYCILDESQAIKNASSSTAQACKAVNADNRVAMTGTPVENNLSELFSQLNFLNPGLFGTHFTADFATILKGLSDEKIRRLQTAIRPFLMRRTKDEVAKDLPGKSEQILWCEMEDRQKGFYEELHHFYQQKMQAKKEKKKEKKAGGGAMDALSALLRLRQASCHPGLVNEKFLGEESGKLVLLQERVETLVESGHKVLIFSQFTKLLSLVKLRLQNLGIVYCYLDGQTKDRKELVEKFQTDSSISCFLISLKAGGVGLNLTAADYVFILDPWWNPAVEAQAIDRAYRIGQTKPVTAYRLITKDTVEEKVMQMQQQKKQLADFVLNAAPSRGFTPSGKDLEKLLE